MTTIEIVSDANGSHRLVGQAHVTRSRGQVSTTFLYDPTYLALPNVSIRHASESTIPRGAEGSVCRLRPA